MSRFDKASFKSKVLKKYKSYEKYSEALENIYGLEKSKEAVTKWGQEKNNNVPTVSQLPIVAKSLGLEVSDLFDNAIEVRENITRQEIKKDPKKYMQYFLSALKNIEHSDEDIDFLLSKIDS